MKQHKISFKTVKVKLNVIQLNVRDHMTATCVCVCLNYGECKLDNYPAQQT